MFLACKRTLPVMLRQGRGAIVNISSLAAIRWTGYPYAAYVTGVCLPVDGGLSCRAA